MASSSPSRCRALPVLLLASAASASAPYLSAYGRRTVMTFAPLPSTASPNRRPRTRGGGPSPGHMTETEYSVPAGTDNVEPPRPIPGASPSPESAGLPEYGMAGVDLSSRWLKLVEGGTVSASTSIDPGDGGGEVGVRYGVRLAAASAAVAPGGGVASIRCEEFVEEIPAGGTGGDGGGPAGDPAHPLISRINATLSALRGDAGGEAAAAAAAFLSRTDGPYAAQLQLVRTLRPPPSAGFGGSGGAAAAETTSCLPPPYDASEDSFVVGPLRLGLRPLVATLGPPGCAGLSTDWDVYHNVSPADTRGHFLLLPTLSDPRRNWRDQSLTGDDCRDLVRLARSVRPAGSLLLSFNSVGAGASQNHVHCHAWPSPPVPLLGGSGRGWDCYAVSRAEIAEEAELGGGGVRIALLDYPCCCVRVSSHSLADGAGDSGGSPNMAGEVLASVVGVARAMGAPHNVGLLNRPATENGDGPPPGSSAESDVDAYVFVRSRERSPRVAPGSRLGASEAMGVFHCQSEGQLRELVPDGADGATSARPMVRALEDVSFEPREELWSRVKSLLEQNLYVAGSE